jgi:hypothetical protein
MRFVIAALIWLVSGAISSALPVVDQVNKITQSVGGRIIYAGNSPGQSFTANAAGLLSQVDVMLSRNAGDIGDLYLEIWPMVAGAPAGTNPAFSTPINPDDVPIGSFGFVSVDTSASMIGVNFGDQYTIAINGTADISGPYAAWNRGNFDYQAGERFDRSGSWSFDSANFDYGFRTWVDADVIPSGLVVLPGGDYNGDAWVNGADFLVWQTSHGQSGTQLPADGNHDGQVNQDDNAVWASAFGLEPDNQATNGSFDTGNLSDWNVVVGPNTNVSFGFPRIESFDVNGDGHPSNAMRVRLGRLDTDLFGGSVSIQQNLLLTAGDYEFSADVASQSLEAFGNTGPGNYELTLDGVVIDQVFLNGTSIDAMEVIRESLSVRIDDVEAGYHTLGITIARGATNSREIYQFIDNIQMTPVSMPLPITTSQAAPEPTSLILLGITMAAYLPSRSCRNLRR